MALVAAARPAEAATTTAGDLPCTGGATKCTLDTHTDIPVSPGSILDFGTRDLTLKRATGLRVGPSAGSMTILAKSVTLEPGASLFASGGQILVTTTGDIRIAASGGNNARIDVSANLAGGSVSLNTSSGGVDIAGILNAKAAAGDGGSIDVTAVTRVDVSGEVTSTGRGTNAAGGSISLKTSDGPITINGPIDVSGTEGGGGDIDVQGSAGVTTTVKLDASGGGSGGSGGSITILSSKGMIVMHAGLDGRGAPAGAIDFGGSGAVVEITAAQSNVTIEGQLILSGGAPDGEGGSVEVDANGDLTFTAGILAQGNGVDGCGSPDGINLMARGDITLADIDVSGGTCGGGSVEVHADAKITLGPAFEILADSSGPLGPAGVVSLDAETVQIDGDISANSEEFIGGDVTIDACGDLSITKTNNATEGSISASGEAGATALLARGVLRVAGRIFSGEPPLGSQGTNTIEYRSMPNLTGSSILPPPSLTPNLDPCDSCGNGIKEENKGEECDDGNRTDGDTCDSNCTLPRCGNGIIDDGESCDDHNTTPCDGCSANCTRIDNVCGDGTTECNEACDGGNTDSCDGCKGDCSRTESCGDGFTECDKECDDGNHTPGDGCDAICKLEPPPGCGSGPPAGPGEGCDDGNTVDGDGCSHLCELEVCGNGIKDSGEACDDHNIDPCDGCSADCKSTDHVCGDGHVDCGEQCDDHNLTDGDGCDSNCTPTGCGNGIMTLGEACDDGNTNSCDGCAATCSRGDDVCGDRIIECSEDCDPPAPGQCDQECHEAAACGTNADCGGLCTGRRCLAGACVSTTRPDCDDHDPCTVDSCSGDACRYTTAADGSACDDGNACTTVETCQSGQCVGTAKSCDDGDFCTDDSVCAPATGCGPNTRKTGIAGVTCQLDAIDDALARGAGLVKGPARAKISSAVRKARSLLSAASSAAGTPRARKKLQASKKALKALAKAVKMARKKQQLTEPLGGLVDGHVSGALGALSAVQI